MKWEVGLLLLGIVFIIMALFSFGRSRKKKNVDAPTAREHLERTRQRQGVRNDLQGLMVEIEQMAKRMGAQLDAKTIHLEKALREADERIAQLQALRDTGPRGTSSGGGAAGSSPYALPTDAPSQDAPGAPLADLSPTGLTDADVADEDAYTDPLTREVYALADRGQGAQSIAQSLGEHVGKVELILALRQG